MRSVEQVLPTGVPLQASLNMILMQQRAHTCEVQRVVMLEDSEPMAWRAVLE
jgi:hypothetical protein